MWRALIDCNIMNDTYLTPAERTAQMIVEWLDHFIFNEAGLQWFHDCREASPA